MSLRHAILGFLSIEPATGYDLKKAFDSSVRHFWSADQAAIYRTLTDLVAQGMVEREVINQTHRPDRKLHRLTDAGSAELARWLAQAPEELPRREPFLMKLFFLGPQEVQIREQLLEQEERKLQGECEQYRQIARQIRSALPPRVDPPEQFVGPLLTLSFGLRAAEAQLAWLREVRGVSAARLLDALDPQETEGEPGEP